VGNNRIRAEAVPDARAASREPDKSGKPPSCDNRGTRKHEGGEDMETKIKAVLREKRMTVHQMHREVGGNRSHCYQVASGVCRATVPMREKIAAFLGMQVDELFDENGMARK